MSHADRGDHAARELVRTAWDVNLVVEAGAGTGKTTLLVERTLHAVLERRVPVTEIALITFMEKAAMELRDRLAERLRQAGDRGAGDAGWIRRQLAVLPDAPITTLHGLGHRIVQNAAHRLFDTAEPEVWDAIETDRQRRLAFEEWLREFPRARRHLTRFRSLGIDWGRWQDLLIRMPRDATAESPPPPPEPLDVLIPAWAEDLQHLYRAALQAGVDPAEAGRRQIEELYRQAMIFLRLPEEAWPRLLLDLPLKAPQGNQARWKPHQHLLQEQKARLRAWAERIQAWRQAWAETVLADLVTEAREFQQFWDAWRRTAGAVTFEDQIRMAVELLQHDPDLRARESGRIRQLMVDEFQDTDPLQVELVQWLAQDPTVAASAPGEAPVPPGRLVVVGDVKQAIYRFRGADVENARRWMTRLVESGQAMRVAITDNFRSAPAIIHAVNRVFADVMTGQGPHPPYTALTVGRSVAETERPRVYRLPAAGETRGLEREQEAELAARFMTTAWRDGWPVRDPDGRERAIGPNDMALLVPRRTGLDVYREALTAAGLPLRASGARQFYRREEIRALAAVLRASAVPDDAPAVLAALRSPVFGLSDEDLGRHRQQGGSWHPLVSQPPGPVADALAVLRSWASGWDRLGAAGVLAAAWSRTGDGDLERLANVDKLVEQAWRYGRRWGFGVYSRWLWERVQAGDLEDEAEAPGVEGVRVTSIHQAKGLEWPLVVVAGLSGRGQADGPILVDAAGRRVAARIAGVETREWATTLARVKEAAEAEERRLWYVALTRAKEYLAVSEAAPPLFRHLLADWPVFEADHRP
jgi:ATP-dependent exoDNAse (exonuclease V) beta subunit